MNFLNQVVLIAGGASGMGKACVQYLQQRGMRVVVWDKQVDEQSEADLFISCDVTLDESAEKAMQQTIEQLGVPRVCVNCAGIAPAKRIVGRDGPMPLAAFKQVIDVNLIGTFNVMRVAAHAMSRLELESKSLERGVIINTASIAAFEGQIGQAAYSASKGGVVAMTLPAARELAQFAIRVNTIAPGLIATPMLLNMPQEVQDNLMTTMTFPKRFGKPSEFAALVAHIIENEMMNGEVIRLDGALRMQ
ncbi:SDR family NAD(P)-dependent oxidoreductase [Legionella longbeachae]|uniref:Putative 3-hydroxyacyl-CoA dehydrogenase type II n=1 Tax=Legionella longbeachae serogroup 1 (strain NSW150) TaxID=661367 RepID=D3HQM4_LEGLN|nr:SDR family NAD(P)-dependent oxidoreductase [Legionella longbeachae]VEE01710.1 3-hydroxyacyl-CoA dehydrogenase [Legionella oakridgensis]HBD7396468.1 SDR family oxidoreductase [Legionella pneumophila]ARB91955.1 3-hydroxyacyl-CoA dehydrogenase [Legionella longbeachae]ARM34860.1 SDR family oxidoreductase [Legionella longbeachae]EEZ95692.1 short chain dehydrogenase/reductase family oxidoreductase [Legionella longbeachae D-4968]